MAPEAHLSPGGAGNTHDTGDLLQPAHDSLQLLAVGYIHGQRDQSEAVGGGAGVEGGYVSNMVSDWNVRAGCAADW